MSVDVIDSPEWRATFARRFAHGKVYVGDTRLHYVRGGRGSPLLLLHGWPATWYEWRRVMPALAEHFDVVALDIRGLGDSSRPVVGYDKDAVAAELAGFVRELGFDKVHVAGHDIGGQIAFSFARNHADLLDRVAIMDIVIPGLHEWDASQLWHFAFQAQPDVPEMLVSGREREYIGSFFAGESFDPSAITAEDVEEYVRTHRQPGAPRAGFAYYRAFAQDAAVNRAWMEAGGKLTMPVLWLGGLSATNQLPSGQAEPAGVGDLLARQLAPVTADLHGEVLDRCGHWMSSECPDRVASKLIAFFRGDVRG